MKILIITNLFPNSKEPTRGMYNKQQFMELAKLCDLKVVAPIPRHHFSCVPVKEIIEGIEVYHPRYFMIPKIGRSLYGFFFFISLAWFVKKIYKYFQFNLIFATWAYPDGFGSLLLAKVLKKPIVIKVHGSDINIYTKYFLRRKMIAYALRNSQKIIVVADGLRKRIEEIGVPVDKIAIIPNGVDTNIFKPMDMQMCRRKLGLLSDKVIILFVGNLVPVKGLMYLIDAFEQIVSDKSIDLHLVILGDGPLKQRLKKEVERKRIDKLVDFVGRKTHTEIPFWINAGNLLCLSSLDEGCPNVVLEALACGKPIVASNVGGLPEIINSEDLGILVEPKNPKILAQALIQAIEKSWNYRRIREKSLRFSWEDNAEKLKNELSNSIQSFVNKKKSTLKKYFELLDHLFIPKKIIIWNAKRFPKRIALTFDDGPNPKFTPLVLEILKEKNVKATFFLVGKEIKQNRELAKRIIDEGHYVGMHSYSHSKWRGLDLRGKKEEIVKSKEILRKYIGINCNIFRPPQGSMSIPQLLYCLKERLTTVLWSIDSRDFECKRVKHILDNVIGDGIRGGDIILFHDDNRFTLEAMPEIIEHFRKRDFEFVTIEEMLK